MAKSEPELMVAVEAFVGTLNGGDVAIKRGLELPSDHRIVKAWPQFFIAHAAGEQAAVSRRNEIERAMELLREEQREELRAARIAQGSKFDASDDVTVESTKRAVRNNPDLELVHDPLTGLVLGAKIKASVLELARQAAEKAQRDGSTAGAAQQAAQQAAREA